MKELLEIIKKQLKDVPETKAVIAGIAIAIIVLSIVAYIF